MSSFRRAVRSITPDKLYEKTNQVEAILEKNKKKFDRGEPRVSLDQMLKKAQKKQTAYAETEHNAELA